MHKPPSEGFPYPAPYDGDARRHPYDPDPPTGPPDRESPAPESEYEAPAAKPLSEEEKHAFDMLIGQVMQAADRRIGYTESERNEYKAHEEALAGRLAEYLSRNPEYGVITRNKLRAFNGDGKEPGLVAKSQKERDAKYKDVDKAKKKLSDAYKPVEVNKKLTREPKLDEYRSFYNEDSLVPILGIMHDRRPSLKMQKRHQAALAAHLKQKYALADHTGNVTKARLALNNKALPEAENADRLHKQTVSRSELLQEIFDLAKERAGVSVPEARDGAPRDTESTSSREKVLEAVRKLGSTAVKATINASINLIVEQLPKVDRLAAKAAKKVVKEQLPKIKPVASEVLNQADARSATIELLEKKFEKIKEKLRDDPFNAANRKRAQLYAKNLAKRYANELEAEKEVALGINVKARAKAAGKLLLTRTLLGPDGIKADPKAEVAPKRIAEYKEDRGKRRKVNLYTYRMHSLSIDPSEPYDKSKVHREAGGVVVVPLKGSLGGEWQYSPDGSSRLIDGRGNVEREYTPFGERLT